MRQIFAVNIAEPYFCINSWNSAIVVAQVFASWIRQ